MNGIINLLFVILAIVLLVIGYRKLPSSVRKWIRLTLAVLLTGGIIYYAIKTGIDVSKQADNAEQHMYRASQQQAAEQTYQPQPTKTRVVSVTTTDPQTGEPVTVTSTITITDY